MIRIQSEKSHFDPVIAIVFCFIDSGYFPTLHEKERNRKKRKNTVSSEDNLIQDYIPKKGFYDLQLPLLIICDN